MYYEPRFVTWAIHPDYRFKHVPNIGVESLNGVVYHEPHPFRPKVVRGMWRDVDSALYHHFDMISIFANANRLTKHEAERCEQFITNKRLTLRGFDEVNLSLVPDYGPADPRRRRYDRHGHMRPIVTDWKRLKKLAIKFLNEGTKKAEEIATDEFIDEAIKKHKLFMEEIEEQEQIKNQKK